MILCLHTYSSLCIQIISTPSAQFWKVAELNRLSMLRAYMASKVRSKQVISIHRMFT